MGLFDGIKNKINEVKEKKALEEAKKAEIVEHELTKVQAVVELVNAGQFVIVDTETTIVLKKKEVAMFHIDDIVMSENRSVRDTQFGSSRVRVAKGLSVGGGSAHSKSHDELTVIDKGTLTVTNQRLVFVGKTHTSNMPFNKIVSVQTYTNGIVIGKEGKKSSQQFLNTETLKLHMMVNDVEFDTYMHGGIIAAIIRYYA